VIRVYTVRLRRGDRGTEKRKGEGEKGRKGDRIGIQGRSVIVSPSPFLPFSPSPFLPF